VVDAQPTQRAQYAVNGLAGDIGLHHIAYRLHRDTGQHRHMGGARLGEQQLPNSIGMGRRRDHPDVQHGNSEAKGRSIKVDTSER
jgi:hypothetical protein